MPVKSGWIVLMVMVYFSEVTAKTSSGDAPKKSSVIYQAAPKAAGNGEKYETSETQAQPRGRRQSYSYGATQRPVSYHEEYNSPPYYYESNNPPQSYHHEYHSPPSSYNVDYNERPQNHHHSYRSPPQQHRSSYNNQDSNEYHDGNQESHQSDPYGEGNSGGGDDYGDNEGYDGYENSPSNRFEREIRGDPERVGFSDSPSNSFERVTRGESRSPREEFTGRINLDY